MRLEVLMRLKDLSLPHKVLMVATLIFGAIAFASGIWALTSAERTVGLVGEFASILGLGCAIAIVALDRKRPTPSSSGTGSEKR